MLRGAYKPIVCYVGRLDRQKGVHLVHDAVFYVLAHGAQFVLLGSADRRSAATSGISSTTSTTTPASTSRCSSAPGSRTSCTSAQTCW